ncbi:hypothetical protein HS088_TW19G00897 [Tripterygium wilfordii]|uniref:Uncharacterized protein n=1 Tax=Tripterygium wilfordii TaxID=458696 RepID=A0A7J7CB25_TRIWF|nr:hypothetical protein HS088_TW19G00897 [Tripterygium wilfordii]
MEIGSNDVLPDDFLSYPSIEEYCVTHNIQSPYSEKDYSDRLIVTRIMKANLELKDVRLPLCGGMPFHCKGAFKVVFKPAGQTFEQFLSTKRNRDRLFDFPNVGLEQNKAFRVSQYFKDIIRNLIVFVEVMVKNSLSCNFDLNQCYIFDMDGSKATIDVVDVDKLKCENDEFFHSLLRGVEQRWLELRGVEQRWLELRGVERRGVDLRGVEQRRGVEL